MRQQYYRLHLHQKDHLAEFDGFIRNDENLSWCKEHESKFTLCEATGVIQYITEHVDMLTTFKLIPIAREI